MTHFGQRLHPLEHQFDLPAHAIPLQDFIAGKLLAGQRREHHHVARILERLGLSLRTSLLRFQLNLPHCLSGGLFALAHRTQPTLDLQLWSMPPPGDRTPSWEGAGCNESAISCPRARVPSPRSHPPLARSSLVTAWELPIHFPRPTVRTSIGTSAPLCAAASATPHLRRRPAPLLWLAPWSLGVNTLCQCAATVSATAR